MGGEWSTARRGSIQEVEGEGKGEVEGGTAASLVTDDSVDEAVSLDAAVPSPRRGSKEAVGTTWDSPYGLAPTNPADPPRDTDPKQWAAAVRPGQRPVIVVTCSALANLTGVRIDVEAVARVAHRYGAIAVADAAAAAPHVPMSMNRLNTEDMDAEQARLLDDFGDFSCFDEDGPGQHREGVDGPRARCLDAMVVSPHKFIGGPSTPGVLVMKRELLTNTVPSDPGGGTVFFVRPDGTPLYHSDPTLREEGGTPDIVGSIRCGLALRMHMAVGRSRIAELEAGHMQMAIDRLQKHPRVHVVPLEGDLTGSSHRLMPRAGILSFVVSASDARVAPTA